LLAAVIQTAAVHGLGGVGKTQLAVQYAWLRKADYDAVLWVNADTPSALLSNISELGGPALLDLADWTENKQEARLQAVMTWLRTNRRWLLIFDTADSKDAISRIRSSLPRGLQGS